MMLKNLTSDFCDLHRTTASRAFFGSALAIVTIVGTVGNLVLAHYVMTKSERRSLVNVLLATMAISDTFISVLCAPFDFLAIVYNRCVFSQPVCFSHSFLLSFFVVLDVAVLVILSFDRYFILVLKEDKLRSCCKTTIVSVCGLCSAAVSCPMVIDAANVVLANEHCRQAYGMTYINTTYSLTYSCLLFVLPCGLLLLGYVHIIVVIRKAKRTVRPQYVRRRSPVQPVRVDVQFKQKTFSTILYLYGAAMVCRLPLALSVFFKSFGEYAVCPVAQWIMLLTYINSAINPVIYAFKIREYRSLLAGKLYKGKSQIVSFRREQSHRSQPQSVYIIPADVINSVL